MPSLPNKPETAFRTLRRRLLRTCSLILPATLVLIALPASSPLARQDPGVAGRLLALPPATAGTSRVAALKDLNVLLARHEGRAGAVILDTDSGVIYENGGEERFQLASVSKLYILVAYLDSIEREDRQANEWELKMMTAMIEESDNRSAADLWDELGEVEGVQEFLKSRRIETVEPPEVPEEWGEMKASALEVGILLRELYDGRLLSHEHTRYALDLLGNIIDEQAWGVGAAQDGSGARQTYLKNGWYPEEEGWTINSAGIVDSDSQDYVVVLLTDSQPSLEEGVGFIESAVRIFRDGLLSEGGPDPASSDLTPPRPAPVHPGRAAPADNP